MADRSASRLTLILGAATGVPLLLSLVPFLVRGEGAAVAALLGGLVAAGGAVYAAAAFRRDIILLCEQIERALNGNAGDWEEAGTPPFASMLGHRLHGLVLRLCRADAERLASTRGRLDADDALIEVLHNPLLLIGAERHIERANAAARALFGERIVGRDFTSCLRRPDVVEAVNSVLAGGTSRSVEFVTTGPVERVFEIAMKPFREPVAGGRREDRPLMVVMTLHDITGIRRSDQMRADFIANVSHELRTPLSSLSGFIETLLGPARDDADARERFLGIMRDQAARMNRLIQDLMSLSRIEVDEHMPPLERVDLVRNVGAVVDSLELKAEARGIVIKVGTEGEVPEVVGDADQLTQVFQNLVSNAVKYTREETTVSVTVSVVDGRAVGLAGPRRSDGSEPDHRVVAVAVADKGEGIAREHLPRLTERFYRVDAARSRAMGGTGLGLAIVKHIMNRHRGRLQIESEVGLGSTFTVFLPVEGVPQPGGSFMKPSH